MTSHSDRRRALVRGGVSLAALLALGLVLPAYFIRSKETEADLRSHAMKDAASFESGPAVGKRSDEATRLADKQLTRRIDALLDERKHERERWGVHVVSLRDGRVLYARDSDRLFAPASNMKLYTTAVALESLGGDYRWRTSVYAPSAPDADGTIKGDLVLYGRGAPDLSSRPTGKKPSDLAELADKLYAAGVRRVRGEIVGDESFFSGEALGSGWLWEDVQWYYGAEPSALSIDDNEFTLSIAPGKRVGDAVEIKLIPDSDYVRVVNVMKTVERGVRPKIGITRELSSNAVRVWGEFPANGGGYGVRLSIQRPALRAASLFRAALRARGIAVEGEARAVDARSRESEAFDVGRAVELASIASAPLGAIVRETNKKSLNLQAELLLRIVGKERGDQAPEVDPERTRMRSTDAAGLAVLFRWLREKGVETGALSIRDGSGLSRFNLITPEATTGMLVQMARTQSNQLFRDSLPLAGIDGTLDYRMRRTPAQGKIAAKTGGFTHVSALSGYAITSDGEGLAFSIICNDDTGGTPGFRAIDSLATFLTAYPDLQTSTS